MGRWQRGCTWPLPAGARQRRSAQARRGSKGARRGRAQNQTSPNVTWLSAALPLTPALAVSVKSPPAGLGESSAFQEPSAPAVVANTSVSSSAGCAPALGLSFTVTVAPGAAPLPYTAAWVLGALVVLSGVLCTAVGLKEKPQADKGAMRNCHD